MTSTIFGKAWGALIVLLVVVWGVFLGIDLHAHDWRSAIVDGIMLAFWVFLLVWLHYITVRELKDQAIAADLHAQHAKAQQNVHHALGDFFEKVEHDMKERAERREKFVSIFNEVTGKDFFEAKTVSAKHKATIEKRFLEATGLYATINVHKDGTIDVDVTEEKPVAKPAAKKAPVKKAAAKPAPAKKNVTTKKGK